MPSSFPSLVYLADMYGINKSNEPLLIKKTSFEVKHCKIETVFILRSPSGHCTYNVRTLYVQLVQCTYNVRTLYVQCPLVSSSR